MFAFYSENGLFITIAYAFSRIAGIVRNLLLSRKLDCGKRLNIGPRAYLRGLSSIRIGHGFTSGMCLRLEAVMRHNGLSHSPRLVIKDNVSVSDFVHIGVVNYVEIGNNVLMGSKVYITDHGHGSYSGEIQSSPEEAPNSRSIRSEKRVVIEDNAWIGEGVTVLPGVTIGRGSIIGANSVVSKNIPPYCIAAGVPAEVLKKWEPASKKWEKFKS